MSGVFEAGQVFEIEYPFVWDTRDDFDPNSGTAIKVRYWRPGHTYKNSFDGSTFAECDAFGSARFMCVGSFRPTPYPTRVFFTREFCSPTGVWFGKNKLRIATLAKFRKLIAGYQFKCELSGLQVAA